MAKQSPAYGRLEQFLGKVNDEVIENITQIPARAILAERQRLGIEAPKSHPAMSGSKGVSFSCFQFEFEQLEKEAELAGLSVQELVKERLGLSPGRSRALFLVGEEGHGADYAYTASSPEAAAWAYALDVSSRSIETQHLNLEVKTPWGTTEQLSLTVDPEAPRCTAPRGHDYFIDRSLSGESGVANVCRHCGLQKWISPNGDIHFHQVSSA